MTTHTEDAMTRERALETLRKRTASSPVEEEPHGGFSFKLFFNGRDEAATALAALASAQQEPAPSTDAEGVAREIADAVRNEAIDGPDWDFDDKVAAKVVLAMLKKHAAALRRYAGDGGVTEALAQAYEVIGWLSDRPEGPAEWLVSEEDDCTRLEAWIKREPLHFERTMDLVAAARAKPSEKGRADV